MPCESVCLNLLKAGGVIVPEALPGQYGYYIAPGYAEPQSERVGSTQQSITHTAGLSS